MAVSAFNKALTRLVFPAPEGAEMVYKVPLAVIVLPFSLTTGNLAIV
jgi:hypothetical protein